MSNIAYDETQSIELTIADRVNYPYILANQLITIQRVLLEGEEARILDSIESLINMIPSEFDDEKFINELTEATEETEVDVRPRFAGTRMNEDLCKELGIPVTETQERRDRWKAQKAVYNLLQRRGMLSKKRWLDLDLDPMKWEEYEKLTETKV